MTRRDGDLLTSLSPAIAGGFFAEHGPCYDRRSRSNGKPSRKETIMDSKQIVSSLAIAATLLASTAAATAAPVAAPGYSISVFAAGPTGTSAADSVEVIGNDVYVGYGNGGAPDGSGGAMSTIVE